MQAPRNTLNVHFPWPQTARLLGLERMDNALPSRGRCPLCQAGRFSVYEDIVQGGAWFSCPDCSRAGDLIELAAAVWDMSLSTALRKFRPPDIPARIRAFSWGFVSITRRKSRAVFGNYFSL
jgi:hypothetical protein